MHIALDFDGVLHSYSSGYTTEIPFDPPTLGAVEFVKRLYEKGHEISIYTARLEVLTDTERNRITTGIKQWLHHHGFPEQLYKHARISCKKHRYAEVLIDDRGYRFDGNFTAAMQFINDPDKVKPWNR